MNEMPSEELMKALEENAETLASAQSSGEAAEILREKGIDVTAEQLESLMAPARVSGELDDSELEDVVGGLNLGFPGMTGGLFGQLFISKALKSIFVKGGQDDPAFSTMEYRSQIGGGIMTLELRGSDPNSSGQVSLI